MFQVHPEMNQKRTRDLKMLYAFCASLSTYNSNNTVDNGDSAGEIYSRLVLAQGLLPVAADSK